MREKFEINSIQFLDFFINLRSILHKEILGQFLKSMGGGSFNCNSSNMNGILAIPLL